MIKCAASLYLFQNLPKLRGPGALTLRLGVDQRNGFAYARATAAPLVLALREVIMQMDDICDACPMLLNDF